jgi:hypothetical protein
VISSNKRVQQASVLKRHDAKRQREDWYYRLFQVKAVKIYDVPQEKPLKASMAE